MLFYICLSRLFCLLIVLTIFQPSNRSLTEFYFEQLLFSIFLFRFQFLASSIKNLLILDGGITMAFPTIVIPALTGLNQQINPNEFLHITPVQASWLGK